MSRPKQSAQDRRPASEMQSATRAKDEAEGPGILSRQGLTSLVLAVLVLTLAAVSSTVSQLSLSPVYGTVPSVIYHRQGMMVAVLCGWLGKSPITRLFSENIRYFIPPLAFTIPTIQYYLFRQSTRLGPVRGPLVTEALTCYPLVALSSYTAAFLLQDVALRRYGRFIKDQCTFVASYLLFSAVEKWSGATIPNYMGSSVVLTRSGLQLTIAALYALSLPSKFLLMAIPSLLFSAVANVHMPLSYNTDLLNSTLKFDNYVLLQREESLTGYLSVLQDTKNHFKALRCDHSILGGEWTFTPAGAKPQLAEPIYAVFTMLEAVRLILNDDGSSRKADADSSALVIGLGIGTTPAALATHGVDTTVVEIDPMVYQLALDHFSLPPNITPQIRDAKEYVEDARHNGIQFDYIVHDVFTGGVEPVDLFTVEFMHGVYDILADDGVVSINYAGDLMLPLAGQVFRTIKSVFPTCRIFRESEARLELHDGDFTNTVIFCKKSAGPLKFRRPVKGDFLGSRSRESHLLPQFEIDQAIFEQQTGDDESQRILEAGKLSNFQTWQNQGAIGHWEIMRKVIPRAFWENW